jgi:anti-sigma regulatory factor (Ser/Thr protein kinase)
MTRILVVDDNSSTASEVRRLLECVDIQVDVARDEQNALVVLGAANIDAVLAIKQPLDAEWQQLREAIRLKHSSVPVVLLTNDDTPEEQAQLQDAKTDSCVAKQSMDTDLIPLIQDTVRNARRQRNQSISVSMMSTSETRYRFGNDHEVAARVITCLENDLRARNYFDPTEVFRIVLALREAIVNAIDHGNLQLESELRDDSHQSYRTKGKNRAEIEPYCDRHVTVTASLNADEIRYIIEDEGDGFDPSLIPDPVALGNLERCHGRGLMLMQNFLDEVTYNETGNKITLVKRCESAAESEKVTRS